eukprot:1157384-Pelagomonas_calceolata.AAC.5
MSQLMVKVIPLLSRVMATTFRIFVRDFAAITAVALGHIASTSLQSDSDTALNTVATFPIKHPKQCTKHTHTQHTHTHPRSSPAAPAAAAARPPHGTPAQRAPGTQAAGPAAEQLHTCSGRLPHHRAAVGVDVDAAAVQQCLRCGSLGQQQRQPPAAAAAAAAAVSCVCAPLL